MPGRAGYHDVVSTRTLTHRQSEVLELVAKGRTNGEIATDLGIGFDTVKTHVSEILGRLGVESREEAAAVWRSEQSVFSRLRRPATGFFLGSAGKISAALATTAVAIGVAVAIFAMAGQDDPSADDDPPAVSTPAVTPVTPTATEEFADFGPTLTGTQLPEYGDFGSPTPEPTAMPIQTVLAGKPVRPMRMADPVNLPAGVVLNYRVGCYQCDGSGPNTHRAYRNSAGELVTERLMPDFGENSDRYASSFASNGDGLFFLLICNGYCGGVGELRPGSTAELWRSKDGGITWETLDSNVPPETWLGGIRGGEVIAQTYRLPPGGGAYESEFAWYPGGRPEPRPAGMDDAVAIVREGELTWIQGRGVTTDGDDAITLSDSTGSRVVAAPEQSLYWTTDWAMPGAERYWLGRQPRFSPFYLAVTDAASGTVSDVFYPEVDGFDVNARLPDGRLVGTAMVEGTTDRASFWPVIINLKSGTIHPIMGLPAGPNGPGGGNGFTFPIDILIGTPRVVATGDGDCLNVREGASTASTSLGCFAEGVLLMEVEGSTDTWRHVRTPGGAIGWAVSEFLD